MNQSTKPIMQDSAIRNVIWHYSLFLLILAVIWTVGVYQIFRIQWQQIIEHQHSVLLAVETSTSPNDVIDNLSQDLLYVYVTQSSAGLEVLGEASNSSSVWLRWYRRIIFEARQNDGEPAIIQSPAGDFWIYTPQFASDASAHLLLQPFWNLAQTFLLSVVILTSIVLLTAASPYMFWRSLRRRLVEPLYELTDISEAIRWRGYLQDDERQRLQGIVDEEYDTRVLAQALMAMEKEISNRFFQLSTLLNTSQIVVSSLDTEQVLNNILVEVQSLFACDRCAIVTLDEERGTFRIQASRGLSPYYVKHLNIVPSEPNSSSMRALRNQAPIQVVDTETDLGYEEFKKRARRENFRSVMSIPLKTTHTPPSVLNLYKNAPYRYSHSERELAISFGNHASLALENATLFKQTDEQVKLQTRRLVAIVESMNEPLILEGVNHEITYMNSQARLLLGIQSGEMDDLDKTIESLSALITTDEIRQHYQQAYQQTGNTSIDIELALGTQAIKDIRVHFFDVRDNQDNHLGRGQLWQDVSKDKQLDRMKSSLVSTVSHELRTPLATIKGYVTTLLARDVDWDAEAQRHFLETILTETDRLAQLVSNILDLSQIEAGLVNIRPQLNSLNEIVSLVLPSFPPEIQARITVDYDKRIPLSLIDSPRIGTAIRNLIDNAIKYAPQSPIEVSTTCEASHVIFSVRDYGDGITETDKDKIFERFYRSDNGLNRSKGGFGLGLAICKGFVEAHKGEIWLDNNERGTTFSFSLPIK